MHMLSVLHTVICASPQMNQVLSKATEETYHL